MAKRETIPEKFQGKTSILAQSFPTKGDIPVFLSRRGGKRPFPQHYDYIIIGEKGDYQVEYWNPYPSCTGRWGGKKNPVTGGIFICKQWCKNPACQEE